MPSIYVIQESTPHMRVWMSDTIAQALANARQNEFHQAGAKLYRIRHPIGVTYGRQQPRPDHAHAYIDLWGRVEARHAAIDIADLPPQGPISDDPADYAWLRVPFVV